MKLNINGYEVEIRAKDRYSSRANKADTMHFLNTLSIWASEAARTYRTEGCKSLEKNANNAADDIYNALSAAGLYKDI